MRTITASSMRKLGRMKMRIIAVSLVIGMAMAMLVSGLYGASVMSTTIDGFFEDSKLPDMWIDMAEPVNATDVQTVLDNQNGIESYDMRLKRQGVYHYKGEAIPTILVGVEDPGIRTINRLSLEKGRFFIEGHESVALADMTSKGVAPGKTITISVGGRNFTTNVTGLVRSAEYLFTSAFSDFNIPITGTMLVMYVPISELQNLTDAGSGVNDIIIRFDDDSAKEPIIIGMESLGTTSVTHREDHISVVFMEAGADELRTMFPLIGAIFMTVGFISIMMTMTRLVQNDSRAIGVLMSLGYRKRSIIMSYIIMGIVIGAIGAALGVVLGLLVTGFMVGAGLQLYIDIEIVYPFIPGPFIIGSIFAVLSVVLSVFIPVAYITKRSVRDALEYRPRTKVFAKGLRSIRLSRTALLGVRNTTRNPWRMLITVLVVGMTIGISGSWLVMSDSVFSYMSDQIDADTWDLRVDFTSPQNSSAVDEEFLGIENRTDYVIPYTSFRAEAEVGRRSQGALIMACNEMKETKDFKVTAGTLGFDNAVISAVLADNLHADIGDSITLRSGTIETSLRISGIVDDAFSTTVYTKRTSIHMFYDQTNCSGAYVKLLKGSGEHSEVAETVRANPEVSRVIVQNDISEAMDGRMEEAISFLYAFFFISLLITIVVSSSAIIIATMERDMEFATLDTLGIPRSRVAFSVLIEVALIGGMSACIGIPLAFAFAVLMAVVLAEVIFAFPIILTIGAAVITFTMGFAFVMLSSAVPIRYSRKLDTEKTMRERTAG